MNNYVDLSVEQLNSINGGNGACVWSVGLSGVALSVIYGAAFSSVGTMVGAAVGAAWIPVSAAC